MGVRSQLSDFKLMGKLGSGTYGVVWKVVRKLDHTTYALKEIVLTGMSRKGRVRIVHDRQQWNYYVQEQEECVHEVHILARMNSLYIIKYYDCFIENEKLYIVMEYAPGGNLHEYINRQGKKGLPEDVIWRLLLQTLLALHHMHAQKILHRDIKSLNIFLGEGGTVKLGDLGVAKVLSTQTSFAKTIVGTPYYLSPELCSDKPYNAKSDVWAFGVVLYECCTGQHPFDALNQGALIMKILRGRYKSLDTGYSEGLRNIVKKCLSQSCAARPACRQLLAMPAVRAKASKLGIALPEAVTQSVRPAVSKPVRTQCCYQCHCD